MRLTACVLALIAMTAAASPKPVDPLDSIAEQYTKLVLAVGQHDELYVDAYYGPPEWKPAGNAPKPPLASLRETAGKLIAAVEQIPAPTEEMARLRREYLRKQLMAVETRIRMLQGERLSFDQESKALYDAVAPTHPASYFDDELTELDRRLPGGGPVSARYEAYRQQFVIPRDKLETVFAAAIEGCRSRTREHVRLPPRERFTIEYVTNKPWSAYNWYQGHATSLIQVNTDLPIFIDRAIDLACHEGYPGHHVYNALLEQHLVRTRGWMEFTVYPLFSPQSLIAEGTANFGIEVAFPGPSRVAFERERLFPLAGLDSSRAEEYYDLFDAFDRLSYAGNEAARQYLNGEIDRKAAVAWLEKYALMSPPRAEQRVRFFDTYRSYVINYNLGKDLVRQYVERNGGTAARPERRWQVFGELLSSPRLPSGLQ